MGSCLETCVIPFGISASHDGVQARQMSLPSQ